MISPVGRLTVNNNPADICSFPALSGVEDYGDSINYVDTGYFTINHFADITTSYPTTYSLSIGYGTLTIIIHDDYDGSGYYHYSIDFNGIWSIENSSTQNTDELSYSFGIDENDNIYLIKRWRTWFGAIDTDNTAAKVAAYTAWIGGAIPPDYTWKAWTILQGNNGQYRARLTAIKDDSIGNISTDNYGTSSDMIFVSPTVDMVPYARNMNYNTPIKIAWSGVNWMTMQLNTLSQPLTNEVEATFKFFAKNSSETVPIYQETRRFFIGPNNHFYLSFVTDDDRMAGAFVPVYYTVGSTGTPFSWGNSTPTESDMQLIWMWLQSSGSQDPEDIPDHGVPYDNGTTDNGGGGGNPIPQDDIHSPNIPVLGGLAAGMFTVYCPTDTQLGQIASWLWTDNFIDNVKKYFANASDNIISFYVLPLQPANLPTKNFKVGNLENASITGVKYVTDRFVEVDMGSIQIEQRWETYLDFAPYTKFKAYLPGVGIVALDTDDIMCPATNDGSLPEDLGSTISLKYVIDLLTGVLVVYVLINGQIRYQFPGKIGYSIPLTGQNYSAMGSGFITAMAGLASTIASGGTAAPFTAGATAAGIINAMKPEVYRGGNLSGDASMLCLKTPYLIRTSPNKPQLANQEDFTGFPSYKIGKLSDFSGYTEVLDAHVEGISCTEEEREKILAALKGGVII